MYATFTQVRAQCSDDAGLLWKLYGFTLTSPQGLLLRGETKSRSSHLRKVLDLFSIGSWLYLATPAARGDNRLVGFARSSLSVSNWVCVSKLCLYVSTSKRLLDTGLLKLRYELPGTRLIWAGLTWVIHSGLFLRLAFSVKFYLPISVSGAFFLNMPLDSSMVTQPENFDTSDLKPF